MCAQCSAGRSYKAKGLPVLLEAGNRLQVCNYSDEKPKKDEKKYLTRFYHQLGSQEAKCRPENPCDNVRIQGAPEFLSISRRYSL